MIAGMISGLELLHLFLITFFIVRLPLTLLIGWVCFCYAKLLLMFKHPAIAVIAKLVLGLTSLAAIAGLTYGLLRWSGVIMFPTDNGISWNWFDGSWRDDGFNFIHPCSCVLIGIALAVLTKRNAHRAEAENQGAST